jgi:hypothetical protein
MANIVVTSTEDKIHVNFGDYAELVRGIKRCFNKRQIIYSNLTTDNFVEVFVYGGGEWQLDINGEKGLIVDSVNGVEPTDNAHLYELICNL